MTETAPEATTGDTTAEPTPDEVTEQPSEEVVETTDIKFYNGQDTKEGRLPSSQGYLDELEALEAEKVRAVSEDREPDLEHPPATAGQPLVTANQLADTSQSTVASNVANLDGTTDVAIEPTAILPVPNEPTGPVTPPDVSTSQQVAAEDEIRGSDTPLSGDMTTEQDAVNAADSVAATPWADPSVAPGPVGNIAESPTAGNPAPEATESATEDNPETVPTEVSETSTPGATIPPVNPNPEQPSPEANGS